MPYIGLAVHMRIPLRRDAYLYVLQVYKHFCLYCPYVVSLFSKVTVSQSQLSL